MTSNKSNPLIIVISFIIMTILMFALITSGKKENSKPSPKKKIEQPDTIKTRWGIVRKFQNLRLGETWEIYEDNLALLKKPIQPESKGHLAMLLITIFDGPVKIILLERYDYTFYKIKILNGPKGGSTGWINTQTITWAKRL